MRKHRGVLSSTKLGRALAVDPLSSWWQVAERPLTADFVPPQPSLMATLINDLVEYMNGGLHAPLIQAGIVHVQFETVHPVQGRKWEGWRAL